METLAPADCPACGVSAVVRDNKCEACGASVVRPAAVGIESGSYQVRLQLDEDFDLVPVTAHLDPETPPGLDSIAPESGRMTKYVLIGLLTALVGIAIFQIVQWQIPPSSAFVRSLDDKAFESQVMQGEPEQTWVVNFWSPRHARCREFIPIFNEAADAMQDDASFARVRLESASATAQKFAVTMVPSVVVFRGGKVVARNEGFLNSVELQEWLADSTK